MNSKICEMAARIAELEQQLVRALTEELEEKRREVRYVIERGRVAFTAEARALHQTVRQGVWAFLWRRRLHPRDCRADGTIFLSDQTGPPLRRDALALPRLSRIRRCGGVQEGISQATRESETVDHKA